MRRWILMGVWSLLATVTAEGAQVALIELQGPIGPATSTYVTEARAKAVDLGVDAIVLRLDTPGGLDTAMRDIVKSILASPVPVICWVGPSGARAASAGTYILYACHLSAMAPGTNLGAATPVPLGGSWPSPGEDPDPAPKEPGEKDPSASDPSASGETPRRPAPSRARDAGEAKAVNDAVAYIRSLAERHGRNADWAEQAVRTGASLSATAAVEQNIVELVASDVDELLQAAHGRAVRMMKGSATLATTPAEIERLEPGWRLELLAVLSNPTVAYLLLLVGIYGLLLEGYNPGALLPGVVGAISLLLAAYALQMLPVNYAGLALIVLGIALLVVETLSPSFGLLGLGGIIAFVFGSVLLMDTDIPGYGVSRGLIAGIAFSAAAVMAGTLWLLWRARQSRVVTGGEALLGGMVRALEHIDGEGWAEFRGERWRVSSARPLRAGQQARVISRDGLTLRVEPQDP